MENRKIVTVKTDECQLNALYSFLFDDVSGDEKEVLRNQICTLLNALSIAFENSPEYTDTPGNIEQANKLIEAQRNRIYELEKEELSFPFRLYLALEALLDHDPIYQLQQPAEINVLDEEFGIYRRGVKLLAKDIISIHSIDKRKKAIYVRQENTDRRNSIKKYIFNNNDYNFDTLCKLFDTLSHRLIKVSKTAIVNVAFYDISSDNYVRLISPRPELENIKEIKISSRKSVYDTFKNDFIKVKEGYRKHLLSQKKILGYMFYVDSFVENSFVSEPLKTNL